MHNKRIDRPLETTSDAWQKCGNLHTAITNVIWVNQKTDSLEFHWLRALAISDVMRFPAILSGIQRHLKFCPYVNYAHPFITCDAAGTNLLTLQANVCEWQLNQTYCKYRNVEHHSLWRKVFTQDGTRTFNP